MRRDTPPTITALTGFPKALALLLVCVRVVTQFGLEKPTLAFMKAVRSIPHGAPEESARPSKVPLAEQDWL